MTPATLIAAGTLCLLASLLVVTGTAELEPGEPAYPRGEPRARLLCVLLACALTFVAGWQL